MARQAETQMTAAGPGEKNNLLRQIGNVISKPGEKGEIRGAAPTQSVSEGGQHNTTGFTPMAKARLLDRWLDRVVAAAGSQSALAVIMSGLLTWALLGIHYGHDNLWQILISDIQAIVNYIYDSFLVRQQLNGYDDGMYATIQLQSRLLSHVRMLDRVRRGSGFDELVDLSNQQQLSDRDISDFADSLPPETRFGRFVTKTSEILGHLLTICAYWVAVFVWIGIGPLNGWSNDWQLYMNSASSATMVFSFAFIANVRERHSAYMERCLDLIFKVDSALEIKLRRLTGDSLDNPVVVAPPPKMSKIQRATFYYADFVGTLIGIAILVCVMVTWVAIGPVLDFNDNWWLIIGTYAGLVGMNDGFVLRNIQARLNSYVEREFDEIDVGDERLFGAIGLTPPPRETIHDPSLTYRLSEVMARVCAHEITVVLGVLTLVGLVAGSSAMRWSFTGQLLSNVPPSLIENFLMLVLITGHNAADKRSRVNLRNLYDRRLMLLSFVNRLENAARDRDVLSPGDGTKEPASVSCRPKHDA